MSHSEMHAKIRSNPKFAELVGKRTRYALLLTVIVLLPYYTFMMITAFNPGLLGQKLSEGGIMTLGWPVAALLIVGGWLMTGLYIRRANGEFDALNDEILKEARK